MEFKKPKDVETYIQIWGYMDDVVRGTKKGKALTYWKKNATPRNYIGGEFIYYKDTGRVKIHRFKYDDYVANRYNFVRQFGEDMLNYKRLYNVFNKTMAM